MKYQRHPESDTPGTKGGKWEWEGYSLTGLWGESPCLPAGSGEDFWLKTNFVHLNLNVNLTSQYNIKNIILVTQGKDVLKDLNKSPVDSQVMVQFFLEIPYRKALYNFFRQSIPFVNNSITENIFCLLYTSPSPRDGLLSRMPSSA